MKYEWYRPTGFLNGNRAIDWRHGSHSSASWPSEKSSRGVRSGGDVVMVTANYHGQVRSSPLPLQGRGAVTDATRHPVPSAPPRATGRAFGKQRFEIKIGGGRLLLSDYSPTGQAAAVDAAQAGGRGALSCLHTLTDSCGRMSCVRHPFRRVCTHSIYKCHPRPTRSHKAFYGLWQTHNSH